MNGAGCGEIIAVNRLTVRQPQTGRIIGMKVPFNERATVSPPSLTIIIILHDLKAENALHPTIKIERRRDHRHKDKNREKEIKALTQRREINKLAQKPIKLRLPMHLRRQKSQKIVCQRNGQFGHLAGIPSRALAVRVPRHQGAVAPDFEVAEAGERGSAHVGHPERSHDLACETDFAVGAAAVGDDGEADDGEVRSDVFDEFGPDDAGGGEGEDGGEEDAEGGEEVGV